MNRINCVCGWFCSTNLQKCDPLKCFPAAFPNDELSLKSRDKPSRQPHHYWSISSDPTSMMFQGSQLSLFTWCRRCSLSFDRCIYLPALGCNTSVAASWPCVPTRTVAWKMYWFPSVLVLSSLHSSKNQKMCLTNITFLDILKKLPNVLNHFIYVVSHWSNIFEIKWRYCAVTRNHYSTDTASHWALRQHFNISYPLLLFINA